MGRAVDSLGGRYTVAEDVGISVPDVEIMARETTHTAGTCAGGAGDPSPATAYGVYRGMKAAAQHRLGVASLKGLRIAVQGVGHVGYYLCRHLAAEGAKSEEHTSELQSLMRNSYAVFCLKKKTTTTR